MKQFTVLICDVLFIEMGIYKAYYAHNKKLWDIIKHNKICTTSGFMHSFSFSLLPNLKCNGRGLPIVINTIIIFSFNKTLMREGHIIYNEL